MLTIYTTVVTPFQQNARLLVDSTTGEAVWIDPGGDIDRLQEIASGLRPRCNVRAIFLTHAHIDHAGGVHQLLADDSSMELYAHRLDAPLRESIEQQANYFGLPATEYRNSPEPTRYLEHGDTITIGSKEGRVLFVPGHAPGHIALYFSDIEYQLKGDYSDSTVGIGDGAILRGPLLIGGDVLFAGGIGRTDLPMGDYAQLLRSIHGEFLNLPPETLVLSGHGSNTTIERELTDNPFLQI